MLPLYRTRPSSSKAPTASPNIPPQRSLPQNISPGKVNSNGQWEKNKPVRLIHPSQPPPTAEEFLSVHTRKVQERFGTKELHAKMKKIRQEITEKRKLLKAEQEKKKSTLWGGLTGALKDILIFPLLFEDVSVESAESQLNQTKIGYDAHIKKLDEQIRKLNKDIVDLSKKLEELTQPQTTSALDKLFSAHTKKETAQEVQKALDDLTKAVLQKECYLAKQEKKWLSYNIKHLEVLAAQLKGAPESQDIEAGTHSELQTKINEILPELKAKKKGIKAEIETLELKLAPSVTSKNDKKINMQVVIDIYHFYLDYLKNPNETLETLIKSLEEVKVYAMKHPSHQMVELAKHIQLVISVLEDDDTFIDIIKKQLQMEQLATAFMGGFSTRDALQQSSNTPLPENIQRLYDIAEHLPIWITVLRGAKNGSMVPLNMMTNVFTAIGGPFGAFLSFVSSAVDATAGAYENLEATRFVQKLGEVLTEDEQNKLIEFLDFMMEEFTNREELEVAKEQLRVLGAGIQLTQGSERNNFSRISFSRCTKGIEDAALKIKLAKSWKEKLTRIAIQLLIPLAILLFTGGSSTAALFLLDQEAKAFMIFTCIGILTTLMVELYAIYRLSPQLGRLLDRIFPTTQIALQEYRKAKSRQEKQAVIDKWMKDNEALVSEIITSCKNEFHTMVDLGLYNSQILTEDGEITEDLKRHFIEEKENKIAKQVNDLITAKLLGQSDSISPQIKTKQIRTFNDQQIRALVFAKDNSELDSQNTLRSSEIFRTMQGNDAFDEDDKRLMSEKQVLLTNAFHGSIISQVFSNGTAVVSV